MSNCLRLRAAAARRPAAGGGQMDRRAEIQLHRRQQRRRPVAARRPDRGRECGAAARGPHARDLRACTAARRAIGRCANSWSASSSATPASPARPTTSWSPRARCRRSIWSTACCSRAATPSIIEQDCYQGSINRLTPARRHAGRHPARPRRHADGRAVERARRSQAPRRAAEIHLHHPDRAEPDRHHPAGSAPRRAAAARGRRTACRSSRTTATADLIWDGERPPALYAMSERGGVIHIGSFSKSIAPALRVGYIVAPWDVMSRMLRAQDRRRLRRARADGARGILRAAFRRARAGAARAACARSSTR